MAEAPFPAVPDRGGAGFSIRKTLVWAQPEPMLDFAMAELPGGSALLVLEAERVAVYRLSSGRWALDSYAAVRHAQPFPRDLRGRLALQRGFAA